MLSNKNRITCSARTFSFIILGFKEGDFDLNADYQREYVWDDVAAQELMESIFNGWPIGSISVITKDSDCDEPYIEVADGKQRCTTIYRYFNNEFPYIDKHGNEIYFKDLDLFDQRYFKNSITLNVNELSADMTELEKYQYFYKINFSGVAISNEHKIQVEQRIAELIKEAA